ECERGAGPVGDDLAARCDDVPVIDMRGVAQGVEERAGQGDRGPFVDVEIRTCGNVEVRGEILKGDGARPVDDRIPRQLGRDRVVGCTGNDRVVAGTAVHRVPGGRVAVVGEGVQEEFVVPGLLDRYAFFGGCRHLDVIRAGGREG